MTDNVNRPAHYNQGNVQCLDAIASAVIGKSAYSSYLVGNIIKYVWRYNFKNGVEDLKKARYYLDRLIEEEADEPQ